MPLVDKHHEATGAFPVDAGGAELDDPLHQGRPQVRFGRCRGALGGTFSEQGDQRTTEDDHGQEHHRRADVHHTLMVDDDIGNGVGDQPCLGQHQTGGHATENDSQQQEATSPPGVGQKSGVDGTGPPRTRGLLAVGGCGDVPRHQRVVNHSCPPGPYVNVGACPRFSTGRRRSSHELLSGDQMAVSVFTNLQLDPFD